MKNWIFVIAIIMSSKTTAQSYSNFCQPIQQLIEFNGSKIKWSVTSWKTDQNYRPFAIELDGTQVPVFDLARFSKHSSIMENSMLFEADDKSMMFSISFDKSELKKLSELASSELAPELLSYLDHEQLEQLTNFYQRTVHDVIRQGYELTPAVLECDKIVDQESFGKIVGEHANAADQSCWVKKK